MSHSDAYKDPVCSGVESSWNAFARVLTTGFLLRHRQFNPDNGRVISGYIGRTCVTANAGNFFNHGNRLR